MPAASRPTLEQLEDRCVPAVWGNPWPDAGHLTVSFSPDGTQVGSRVSQLFQVLNQNAPTQQWETTILRALQTWAVNANINLGLVSDNGSPFGGGLPQGDPRFGDIRLAAYPMAITDEMAIASPYDPTAGTWAGDIKLNSAYNFGGTDSSSIDLFTAMLHESAHVFGLDHSQDPTSAVYEYFNGIKTGLTAEDIGRLQGIYGPRTPDQFEGPAGNNTFTNATALSFLSNPDGSLGIKAVGDVTTLSDADVYRIQAPLNLGKLQIVLHTSGVSLLVPKVTLYDAKQNVIQSVTSSGPLNGDLTFTVSGLSALKNYYVKVESGTQDVFGIGAYELNVRSIPLLGTVTGTVNSVVNSATQLLNNDLHTNDTMLTASLLGPLTAQTPSRFSYAYKASISDSWDVDYYKVQAPQSSASSTVLSVTAWGLDAGGLIPKASVYDVAGRLVASDVLTNENGIFTLQVANATPGANYFVKIEAANPKGTHNTGNYFVAVQFGGQAVQLDTVAQGTLTAAGSQQTGQLNVLQSALYHFVLSADTSSAAAAGVRMTIWDQTGTAIATLAAFNGQPATSITVALAPGAYTVTFSGGTPDGSALPQLNYSLRCDRLSDPIGPQPNNPTQSPSTYTPPSSSSTTTTSSTSSSTTTTSTSGQTSSSPPPYYYSNTGTSSSTKPSDPYSNPYSTN